MRSALLAMPFRPFFLLAGLFTFLSISLWTLFWAFPSTVGSQYSQLLNGNMVFWHSHEMVFGFAGAVLIGFLFTAVKNWTGLPPLASWQLGLLAILWMLMRLSWWQNKVEVTILQPALAVVFWGLAAVFFARYIIQSKMWRNGIFIFVLFAMGGMDAISVLADDAQVSQSLCRSGVWLLAVAITIIGGRVIPFFTAGATGTARMVPPGWLELIVIPIQILVFILSLFQYPLESVPLYSGLLVVAGLIQLVRLTSWNWRVTLSNPMLWSLYVFYACLGVGEIGLGLASLLELAAGRSFFHVITLGAIGGMIISMVSRVSLGHTGRPIRASKPLQAAFWLLLSAVVIRGAAPVFLGADLWPQMYALSGGLWVVAWGVWLSQFAIILVSKRADGKPG